MVFIDRRQRLFVLTLSVAVAAVVLTFESIKATNVVPYQRHLGLLAMWSFVLLLNSWPFVAWKKTRALERQRESALNIWIEQSSLYLSDRTMKKLLGMQIIKHESHGWITFRNNEHFLEVLEDEWKIQSSGYKQMLHDIQSGKHGK